MILMFKITAMIMIASAFAVAGKCFAVFYQKRVSVLETVILMITSGESRLRYSCLPIGDLLRILNENETLSELHFIKTCREKVCFGMDFYSAWKESIESETEFCRLLGKSAKSLISMGSELGSTDLEGQLSCCRYYKKIFESDLGEQREISMKYSKIFPSLGLLLGVSAAILII